MPAILSDEEKSKLAAANAAYMDSVVSSAPRKLKDVEEEFELKKFALANYRRQLKAAEAPVASPGPFGFEALDHDLLDADETNFRRSMNRAKLDELKASIREHGLIHNLVVRQKEDGRYLVIAGNRRHCATGELLAELVGENTEESLALLADRRIVPAKVLTVEEAKLEKEIQLIENLQKEGLHPLDEAAGYQWLIENKEANAAQIAKRVGFSESYVSRRLRLSRAPRCLLKALDEGLVSVRVCELVGQVPVKADREKAGRMVLEPRLQETPLTVVQTQQLLESDFMLSLTPAAFVRVERGGAGAKDRQLVEEEIPKGLPACQGCKFRSENSAEYDGKSPNVCMNPVCYRKKEASFLARQAEVDGLTVLDDEVARKVFAGAGGEMAYDSEFVDVSSRPTSKETGHHGDVGTWKKQLRGTEAPTVLAVNPSTGKTHTLVRRDVAIEAVNQAQGEKSPFKKSSAGDKRAEQRAAREAQVTKEKATVMALHELVERMLEQGLGSDDLTALLGVVVEKIEAADWAIGRLFGVPDEGAGKVVLEQIRAPEDSSRPAAYLIAALLGGIMRYGDGVDCPQFLDFAARFGVELGTTEAGA